MTLQTEAIEMVGRTCRYCERPYMVEKGARVQGCRRCCPTITDAIEEEEAVGPVERRRHRRGAEPLGDLLLLDSVTGATYPLPDYLGAA